MYRLLCSLSLLVVLFGCAIRPPDPTREFTSQEIAKRLIASTVYIKVVKRDSDSTFSTSHGSGFVIRPGYVATNYHVVDKMHLKFSSVRLVSSERELPIERIIDINKDYDLAIIQCARVKATALPLGDSDKVQIGETVYVSGNPKGFTGTFSAG